ncbi:hypothetical protein AWM75_07865 [Aerococcus urinaehominis]|uniref:DnaB/C C-terminal domain-containing protein n=1 Tax=Aerococcus urinaehominis TaxID=128944 RepID=A0A0X8FM72_9LACT|nr:DnaD domain protein [Aerococcus urinaehominis]AMB99888.1 hypothetical protein AWM75_07865 [Aerococcus urinaehominis]SDM52987.1 DnaD and phage-associated domain-containing protein [Aerococcus urinaehominis]
MTIKRVVATDFWYSPLVTNELSRDEIFFMLYLKTNPQTSQLGIYKLPMQIMETQVQMPAAEINALLNSLQYNHDLIAYNRSTNEIAILEYLSYSILTGGTPVERILKREIHHVESLELLTKVQAKMTDYWHRSERAIDGCLAELFAKEIANRSRTEYADQLLADLHDFWSDYFTADLIDEAYKRSKYKNAPDQYAKTILTDWQKRGVTSLKDVQLADYDHFNQQASILSN